MYGSMFCTRDCYVYAARMKIWSGKGKISSIGFGWIHINHCNRNITTTWRDCSMTQLLFFYHLHFYVLLSTACMVVAQRNSQFWPSVWSVWLYCELPLFWGFSKIQHGVENFSKRPWNMLTHAVFADFLVEIHALKSMVPSHIKRSSTGIQSWELTKSYCVCVCVIGDGLSTSWQSPQASKLIKIVFLPSGLGLYECPQVHHQVG